MVDQDVLRGGTAAGGRLLTARGRRTRANLVAAAKQVFGVTSFADARIADITQQAGTANGTFYTYFDTKEEIFREVAMEVLDEMSASARFDPDDLEGDPAGRVAEALTSYYRTCLRNVGVARSIEQVAERDPEVARARRRTVITGIKMFERWIYALQRHGICNTSIDPWTTAMVLHTMTVRVAYDHLMTSGNESQVEGLARTVTRIWARTLGLEKVEPDVIF